MTKILFKVYGIPVPKLRARTVKIKSGKQITYTPNKTAAWEESVRLQALKYKPDKLLDCPLRLKLIFQLPRPKSRPKKNLYPDRRPDLDNYIKSLKDALSGIIWTDDARIVEIIARKEYGGEPGVWMEVDEFEGGW